MLTAERLLFAGFFVILLLSALISSCWHEFAYRQQSISIALYSFDKIASEQACAEVLIIPKHMKVAEEELRAYLDSKEAIRKVVIIDNKPKKEQLCFDINSLPNGQHFVEIFLGERKIFYSFEKTLNRNNLTKPEIEIIGIKNKRLNFKVKNFPQEVYAPVEIFVNGAFERALYPSSANQEFSEKLSLMPGNNTVEIKAFDSFARIEAKDEPASSNIFVGLIFLLLGIAVFAFFVFPSREIFSRFSLSFGAVLSLFIFLGLILGFIGRFSIIEFSASYCIALALLAFVFRKRFALNEQKIEIKNIAKQITFELIVVLLFFVWICIAYGLFIPSHKTYFNVFYERGTQQILENAGLPKKDELSYLGRNFTFIPGYFYIEGALSLLTGLNGWELFALMCTLGTIFLLFSSIALAKKFCKHAVLLFPIFISMSTVVFSYLTLTPRHSIAFAFLMISLMLMLERKTFSNAAMLFFAMIIQVPIFIFYLFSAPFLNLLAEKKASIKTSLLLPLKPLILACIGFAIIYAMLFWHAGLPYQVMPSTWGYLIGLGPAFALADPGILFVLFALIVLLEVFFFFKGQMNFTSSKKILLFACFAFLLLQCFVSTRFDVLSTLFIALFICHFIDSYQKKFSELFTAMLALLLIVGLYLAIILSQGFTASTAVSSATEFLAHYSSSSENVLADPYYGHVIEFDAARPVLADLMVEYADEQKLSDAYRFLKEKDYALLAKYNIALVFNERFLINEKIVDNELLQKELEFDALAKVFTNEKISIHRKMSR